MLYKLLPLYIVITAIAYITPLYPFVGGIVAMIPIKIVTAVLFNNGNIIRVVDGLLTGSVVTTVCLVCAWYYLHFLR